MFKVLPRGEKLKKFEGKTASEMQAGVGEALRYDLTVPRLDLSWTTATISFPFKRYQIQNVWRGDRPQKGCYRNSLNATPMWSVSRALFRRPR